MAINYSDPMICEWINYIKHIQMQQEIILQNGAEFYMPFIATPMAVIKTIFSIADHFELNSRVKYLAIYLYDRYMCNKFWEIYLEYENDVNNNTDTWAQLADRLSSQSKLRLMSCIQLASKVDSHSRGLGVSQTLAGLKLMNSENNEKIDYSLNTIFNSEFKVFETLKFKIPFITPLDSIEVLLAALNLQDIPKLYDTTILVLDLTFLQHQNLYCKLQFMALGSLAKTKTEKIKFMTMEVDMLFLSASIIICTLFFFNVSEERSTNILDKLANIIGIKTEDIFITAKTIFELTVPDNIISEL